MAPALRCRDAFGFPFHTAKFYPCLLWPPQASCLAHGPARPTPAFVSILITCVGVSQPPPSKKLHPDDPPYAIKTTIIAKDQAVENILSSTSPPPKCVKHRQGGRPLLTPAEESHSPQTKPGYTRNDGNGGCWFTG